MTAFHLSRSESKASEVTAATERCRREIAGIEGLILAGHPDLQGLCQALADWSAELRIVEQEICANTAKSPPQPKLGGRKGTDAADGDVNG